MEEISLERRMSLGRRKKDRGNFWYSRGEFTQAIQNYREEKAVTARNLVILNITYQFCSKFSSGHTINSASTWGLLCLTD